MVDVIFLEIAPALAPDRALIVKIVTLVIDAGIAGVVALFGYLARRGYSWAFIIGMVLYALDGLLYLWVQDFLSVGFHALVLAALYGGLAASRELRKAKAAAVV